MKDSEQDVLDRAAEAACKTHPPLVKTAIQGKVESDRLHHPEGGGTKLTQGNGTLVANLLWFVEERQLNGEWRAVDRADDQGEAEDKLRETENCLPGTYRLNSSSW